LQVSIKIFWPLLTPSSISKDVLGQRGSLAVLDKMKQAALLTVNFQFFATGNLKLEKTAWASMAVFLTPKLK
jgi:hypothetical protein